MARMSKTLSSGHRIASLPEHQVFSAQVSTFLSRKNRLLSQATEARSTLQKQTKNAKETKQNIQCEKHTLTTQVLVEVQQKTP